MTDRRNLTDEFWQRLAIREVEDDLRRALEARAARTSGAVSRVGKLDTVVAVIRQVLPGAAVPALVLAEFLDSTFDRQMGRGDEPTGKMPRAELLPAGFAALEATAGGSFAARPEAEQINLLTRAERGDIPGPEGFDSKTWFARLRELVLLGYGSDPRGMAEMGFPGPSYKPGYLWLNFAGPSARAKRTPGYRSF